MTMTTTRLVTYWNAADAYTVIQFLDELRDLLWDTYGEQIIEMMQAASEEQQRQRQEGEQRDFSELADF